MVFDRSSSSSNKGDTLPNGSVESLDRLTVDEGGFLATDVFVLVFRPAACRATSANRRRANGTAVPTKWHARSIEQRSINKKKRVFTRPQT